MTLVPRFFLRIIAQITVMPRHNRYFRNITTFGTLLGVACDFDGLLHGAHHGGILVDVNPRISQNAVRGSDFSLCTGGFTVTDSRGFSSHSLVCAMADKRRIYVFRLHTLEKP